MHQLLASYQVQMDKPRHDNQADDTNQFDHFRFREDNFAAAAFSTANAWTNGDTGSGIFTASWRDGYANNELTFRTKPERRLHRHQRSELRWRICLHGQQDQPRSARPRR